MARNQQALPEMLRRLFEHWQLTAEDQLCMLGLQPQDRSSLDRLHEHGVLDLDPEQGNRVHHLLAIHARLRLLFPENRDLAYRWMRTRNRAFDNQTPVALVRENGLGGLIAIQNYLDRAIAG
jgi:hypothetical protein